MTVISVAIGVAFSRVPDALMTSLPVGEMAGVALLVVFGLRSLKVGRAVTAVCCAQMRACMQSQHACPSSVLCLF